MPREPEALETEVHVLGPRDEARRLWQAAEEALNRPGQERPGQERPGHDFAPLCEALDLGARAIEILAVDRLATVRADFPASIAMLLESPDPEVDPTRDAIQIPRSLSFLDVIDMLSDDELDCVSPKLHHGWEDRRCSCLRSRKLSRQTAGSSLGLEERDQLLLLAAYRNRIFRVPPPVKIVPAEIRAAFPALRRLYQGLEAPVATPA